MHNMAMPGGICWFESWMPCAARQHNHYTHLVNSPTSSVVHRSLVCNLLACTNPFGALSGRFDLSWVTIWSLAASFMQEPMRTPYELLPDNQLETAIGH